MVTLDAALAAAATLIALAFACSTFDRWLARRRRYDLAWSVALAMFTIASAALWLGSSAGWSGPTFRVFFLFGAILNVPYLALGTVYLLGSQRTGDRVAIAITAAALFSAGVMTATPLLESVSGTELPTGRDVFGPLPRVLAAVGSGGAAVVVIAGAVLSAWRVVAGRERTRGRGIAATRDVSPSATCSSPWARSCSERAARSTDVSATSTAFAVTLTIGVSMLFAGFLVATSQPHLRAVRTKPSGSAESASQDLASPALG